MTGIAVIALSWLADASLGTILNPSKSFLQLLIHPEPREILVRLLFSAFQLAIILYAWTTLQKRKAMEQELRDCADFAHEEKAKSKAIVDSIGDAISIQDTNLKVLYQNEAHRRMMGDHLGEYCYKAYSQKESACPGCHLILCFEDKEIHQRETTVIKDSGCYHYEITSSPLLNRDGKVLAGIELVRDITARKNAEITLYNQMTAIESSRDGIAILDENGVFTFVNKAYTRIYGSESSTAFIGERWEALFPTDEAERIKEKALPMLKVNGHWQGESVGIKTDGTAFPLEISMTLTETGAMTSIVRDISKRKSREDEIEQLNLHLRHQAEELANSNKEMESFSYTLSHDIHTPLSRVYVAAQALEEMYGSKLDETGRFLLSNICTGSELMTDLINSMLVLAKVNRGELQLEEINMSTLAGEIEAVLRTDNPDREVNFIIKQDMKCMADKRLLKIALENLLGNAWKYTSQTRSATIEFGSLSNHVTEYFIKDNGAGFDAALADNLFHPFKRLHKDEEFQGNGIGLATVKRIIERHGGRISGAGEPGKGATFYFTLVPRPSSSTDISPEEEKPGIPTSTCI
jgi:PAS domain S-box-containing protein